MKPSHTKLILILILLTLSPLSLAQTTDLSKLTVDNFNLEYERIQSSYDTIVENNPKTLIRKFKQAKGNHHFRFTREQTQLKKKYLTLRKEKRFIDPIHQLKIAMINQYKEHSPLDEIEQAEIDAEATTLALGLFNEIKSLKKKYKSFFLPIIHNAMLAVKLKKRGACKHWAEDLLEYLKPIERKFFDVTWGEAYPGKVMEHNVAVIIPKNQPFKTGLFIDPWRTGGNPYWLKVTKDSHYKWQMWEKYGRY